MKLSLYISVLVALISLTLSGHAFAQNTGGVFPPGFGDDHRSAQYRIAVNTEANRFAQRLHYQQSVNDRVLWRVVGQTRETAASDFDFDFIQAELFWELKDPKAKYRTGLRFDGRIRNQDRPAQFGVNWMNQWALGKGWRTRAVALSSVQVGDNSADSIFLGARGQLNKALADGTSVGLEVYGNLGSTEDFGLGKRGQTAGPYVSKNIFGQTSVLAGVQFGLTDAAPNTDLRLWVTQGF